MHEEQLALSMHPSSVNHLSFLRKPGFAHLATISRDGSPHSTPMWYAWDGRHLALQHTQVAPEVPPRAQGRTGLDVHP